MSDKKAEPGQVKYGKDKELESDANEWLAKGVRDNKRSVARDVEKMRHEAGLIDVADLRHYSPMDDWNTKYSAYTLLSDPYTFDDVEPTICAEVDDGNIRARSREDPKLPAGKWGRAGAEDLQGMRRHVADDDYWLSPGEYIPLLGNYDVHPNVCVRCGLSKRPEFFSPDARKKNRLASQCKKCRQEVTSQKRKGNRK